MISSAAVALVSSSEAFTQDADTTQRIEAFDRGAAYRGFGLSFGITLFYPSEVNETISDIYQEFKRGSEMLSELVEPFMFWGASLKCKGVIYLNRNFAMEPYSQAFCASGGIDFTLAPYYEYLYVFFFSGGAHCWARFNPDKLVSFKAGVGGFGGYSRIEMDGDIGRLSLSGPGFSGNILAGLDLTFRKVAVNVDFTVPIGIIKYRHRKGTITITGRNGSYTDQPAYTNYPGQILLLGFEIRPGVTFKL